MGDIDGSNREQLLHIARESLAAANYSSELIYPDWEFADVFEREEPPRTVPLVAFGQDPPSYRTACWAVAFVGDQDIQQLRALGAPQVLQFDAESVIRWKLNADGQPERQDQYTVDQITSVFAEQRENWGPNAVLRLKSAAIDLWPRQLDLYDAGLIPAIDSVVFEKLDRILRSALLKGRMIYHEHHHDELDERQLVRLVFRLLAAKVFSDRGLQGVVSGSGPAAALSISQSIYGSNEVIEPVLADEGIQEIVWQEIDSSFNLQNISVEALAHVYENTLITSHQRRAAGTHATPPAIAEYLVRRLPIASIPEWERRVFEPFAGHAVFLIAAMGRLRELLVTQMSREERHDYFRSLLTGMESDPFALEVARLSLLLADYPNPNGWNIQFDDVLASSHTQQLIANSSIVLCNPPFEWFDEARRTSYGSGVVPNPAVEILNRVLATAPEMLGFVLPWSFVEGQSFRHTRRKLVETYGQLEVIGLPDSVFRHSQVEPVLLVASSKGNSPTLFRCAEVTKPDYQEFLRSWQPSWETETQIDADTGSRGLWRHPLDEVWEDLKHLPRLGAIATVHRGIEYNLPVNRHLQELVRDSPSPGFAPGLFNAQDGFEPYLIHNHVYLNVSPELLLYRSIENPWHLPKVIVNAVRSSRGPSRLAAVSDRSGLLCYQAFHGIWPSTNLSVEVLSAILNGFIANAYMSAAKGSRHNTVARLRQVPVPHLTTATTSKVGNLVAEYESVRSRVGSNGWDLESLERCESLLATIDEAVLDSYKLRPELRQLVVEHFQNDKYPMLRDVRKSMRIENAVFADSLERFETMSVESNGSSSFGNLQRVSDVLGLRIVSVIADTQVSQVDRWLGGSTVPPKDVTSRLSIARDIVDMLLELEDAETIQSWFVGKNRMLGDRAPALVLRENPSVVWRAARAFVAYG